ncbi:MAG: D-tyrosyl-tRNA(Tyr) deacylase [Deltaproteobacteria bacterium]|nr:D-tyrosyl-tRNA(Tyr) deacylase [Deltaproteobacteria bacterium]
MRAVIQRVHQAAVHVEGRAVGKIGKGLLIFLGVETDDAARDLEYMITKTAHLRAFPDREDKMNLSLLDISGEALVVSQFTLYGDCRKGRRPSFMQAAAPEKANRLYTEFISRLQHHGITVASGAFQKTMDVSLVNDGPVTFLIDSKKSF